MINRAAVILKYKAPAIAWINAIEPNDPDFNASAEHVNRDRNVYLINEADGFDEYSLDAWIIRNYRNLFETELEDWFTDLRGWPQDLSLDLFYEWFEVECHTAIIDTAATALYDDEI